MLLSHPSIGAAADGFLVRDLGHFLLRGKTHAVHVFELLDERANATPEQRELCARFAEGMASLSEGDRSEALARFRRVAAEFPTDGPTAFYVRMIESAVNWEQGALKVD